MADPESWLSLLSLDDSTQDTGRAQADTEGMPTSTPPMTHGHADVHKNLDRLGYSRPGESRSSDSEVSSRAATTFFAGEEGWHSRISEASGRMAQPPLDTADDKDSAPVTIAMPNAPFGAVARLSDDDGEEWDDEGEGTKLGRMNGAGIQSLWFPDSAASRSPQLPPAPASSALTSGAARPPALSALLQGPATSPQGRLPAWPSLEAMLDGAVTPRAPRPRPRAAPRLKALPVLSRRLRVTVRERHCEAPRAARRRLGGNPPPPPRRRATAPLSLAGATYPRPSPSPAPRRLKRATASGRRRCDRRRPARACRTCCLEDVSCMM
jgi:hypothetical protein